eukprot:PhF_6_TR24014/c0_g1_i1/m.33621/K14538/NUG1, GNL3; nuclear GTP-binding protein
MKSKRQMSKRQTLRRKFSVLRHVREHHRDMRKALKRANQGNATKTSTFRAERAVLKVPNKDSTKEDLLRLALEARKEGKLEKKMKKASKAKGDNGKALMAAQREERRRLQAIARKEAEDQDFILQLAKVMQMSQIFAVVVDARCPQACLSENLLLAAEVHKLPFMILLTKTDLIPEELLDSWIQHLKANTKAVEVMAYNATKFVARIQEMYGMGNKVYVTVAGLPNVGVATLTQNLVELQGGRVSSHPSKEAARGKVPHSREITLLTLPRDPNFNSQPVCGLDVVFRPWQYIVNNLKDVEVHAEEVLRHFDANAVCAHFKMANQPEATPQELMQLIMRRRSMPDVRDAARAFLVDYNIGKLKWCCVPPGVSSIREGWTVLDESFLSTQDYTVA